VNDEARSEKPFTTVINIAEANKLLQEDRKLIQRYYEKEKCLESVESSDSE